MSRERGSTGFCYARCSAAPNTSPQHQPPTLLEFSLAFSLALYAAPWPLYASPWLKSLLTATVLESDITIMSPALPLESRLSEYGILLGG